jgi:hypothetical protein
VTSPPAVPFKFIGNISDIIIHGNAPIPIANIIVNDNIPMKQKIGVIFPIPGTSLTPNATANVIQLKHNPNAEVIRSGRLPHRSTRIRPIKDFGTYAYDH